MNQFHYTSFAQEVIFGAGALEQLREAVERNQWQRLMLCTTGSLVRGREVDALQTVLGDRLVTTYGPVMPHVPDYQVEEAMARAIENEPVIAIPTTYAGSEMTPVYGVTHHGDGASRKVTVTDPKVTPKLTIYDPVLTLKLSPEMTASTGINALAHCVEAAYSITRNPLSTAAALAGARRIASALPSCYAKGDDLEARSEMLAGSYLAGAALSNVAMGLHHGLCHVLGGTAGVPHGVANAIMLPHVMRFNADATAPELAEIGEAMGLARNGKSDVALAEAAAQWVYEMVAEMKLPQRLREAGVSENNLPRLAELAAQSRTLKNNPKPVNAAQAESLLRLAW